MIGEEYDFVGFDLWYAAYMTGARRAAHFAQSGVG